MDEQQLSRGASTWRPTENGRSVASAIWRPLLAALLVAAVIFAAAFYASPRLLNNLSWHLYLDRLHPVFTLPVSWNGRLAMGALAGGLGFLPSLFVGVLLASRAKAPQEDAADSWMFQPVDATVLDEVVADEPLDYRPVRFAVADEDLPARNKQDVHPDDAPRPPLSAERDLPAGGLLSSDPVPPAAWSDPVLEAQLAAVMQKPVSAPVQAQGDTDYVSNDAGETSSLSSEPQEPAPPAELILDDDFALDEPAAAEEDAPQHGAAAAETPPKPASRTMSAEAVLILADLAPERFTQPGSEPWLQTVESTGPAKPHASDMSLSALLARLESGLRRRKEVVPQAEVMPAPVPENPPVTVDDHKVDIALEAALSTLHRMNLRAVG